MRDHVILCGLGKVGYSTLEMLSQQGVPVVAITRDIQPDRAHRAGQIASHLILEDARTDEALIEAGVRDARAIIIATNDDLTNLTIALDARRLAPEIAIVLRLYDRDLAERVRQQMDVRAVLNAAELAAPAFIAAALGEQVIRAFDIGSVLLSIVSMKVADTATGEGQTLREWAAHLEATPLALRSGSAGLMHIPVMDYKLQAGDEVIVAASSHLIDHLRSHHPLTRLLPGEKLTKRQKKRRHFWRRPKTNPFVFVQRLWRHASPILRTAFAGFIALLVISFFTFHLSLGLNWLDALYFTVTILTTVGFGDISLINAPPLVKLLGCVLMVSSVGMFLLLMSVVADYLISRRFEQMLGRPRTTLTDHIIVAGIGSVGSVVAGRLHELGLPVLVIERNPENNFLGEIPDEIPVILADANLPQTMEQAGLDRARAVLALTNDDLVNLRIAHHAEIINPEARTVVRLFQSSLSTRLGPSLLGIDQAFNPSQVVAATFAVCALAADVVQGFTLGSKLLMLRWLDEKRMMRCINFTVEEIRARFGILAVLRQARGEMELRHVNMEEVVREGDRLIVLDEFIPDEQRPAPAPLITLDDTIPEF
jgi:Trk K+ transport system NAD-binding subunit